MQIMNENEQRELEETGELRLFDPRTKTNYVAITEDDYAKVQELKDLRATYPAVLRAWDQDPDPHKGAYNDLKRP